MEIVQMPLGPLGTNCYIVSNDEKDCLIVDPGGDSRQLIDYLTKRHLKPVAIVLTHAHFDHIGAVDEVRDQFNIPVYVHKEEADWLSDPQLNGSAFFQMGSVAARRAERMIETGEREIDSFKFEVRHTPGHSPGSVSLVFEEEGFVIAGDALFQRGIGRTDLPGGDMNTLLNSIKNQLFTLPEGLKVYPGHGPATTIGEEKRENPFVGL
ncbi:hydroxyacylglutathione hydrolase [Thalassobacillus devorans]|uniref:Hydroxyacylglutathione hydrolase n=1 Tax=Thalassobacillus devorans TaxID=279813 RepID=A0ABQ1P5W3_9BACI|nr:MBL fold metallo-hydrolase [Thalassobacillus devorans]NIK29635.1 glyoxylase-like metal-dependent hydrolase (beta-lactamase superfamily II) [Thalassobacillus devorans]GGC91655.1 hydroxyacylglutathione hydrolase [Thalassobacillus devorans]